MMPKSKAWLWLSVILAMVIAMPLAVAEQAYHEVRHYVEQKGGTTQKIRWSLTRYNGFRLTYEKGAETAVTQTDERLVTQSWTRSDPPQGISITAVRKNNVISIHGTYEDRTINKSIQVDDSPWFQSLSLSLQDFVALGKKEISFWILHPHTLKAYKLKATRGEREMVRVSNESVKAVRVELRLTGLLAQFWKSYCWFRLKDGLFIRFESRADPTGTTRITVSYSGYEPTVPDHSSVPTPPNG